MGFPESSESSNRKVTGQEDSGRGGHWGDSYSGMSYNTCKKLLNRENYVQKCLDGFPLFIIFLFKYIKMILLQSTKTADLFTLLFINWLCIQLESNF